MIGGEVLEKGVGVAGGFGEEGGGEGCEEDGDVGLEGGVGFEGCDEMFGVCYYFAFLMRWVSKRLGSERQGECVPLRCLC